MRRSFDGAGGRRSSAWARSVSGHAYLFFNRRRRLAKALWFDGRAGARSASGSSRAASSSC
ncbi:MAG: hypothetical protein KIT72_07560 [Polyangiaceae bacterium]|nr:hypothetical protein [Polyangiaceae bacterium]